MEFYTNDSIDLSVLRKRAYNFRWAEVPEDVIPLTAADPDFPVAPEIRKAIIEYTESGYFPYTPKLGMPEFKESIANSLNRRKSENVDPELVLPIDSVARGMYVIAETVLKSGDHVLIFDPVDYLFRESALHAGAEIDLFPTRLSEDKSGLDISDLESYITPETKMIGLCNPHNPFGMCFSKEQLEFILSLAEKYNLWIMNDEIWSDIVYDDCFTSILSFGREKNKRTLSVYGFSKTFGVAGLRIGCIYVQEPDVFERIVDCSAVMTTAGGISSLSQIAGIACLNKSFYILDEFLPLMKQNRDYAVEFLNRIPGISCHTPQATYMVFPKVSNLMVKSEELQQFLVEKAKVAVVPGGHKFFGPGSEGYMRICFATSPEILKEGLDRFAEGIRLFKGEKNER